MKVYIDLVFVLNFTLDLILLMGVNYILKRNTKKWRVLIGSIFGTITLLILFINLNNITLLLFKIIISLIMILITFGYKDIKYFTKNILYFYMLSMLMGGAITFLNNQFAYSNNGLVFTKHSLKTSYITIIILSIFMFTKYLKSFVYLKNNYSNYYQCKIYFDNNNYITVNAFLDTGNKLNDPYTNKSIILLTEDKIKEENIRSPIYVPYNSLNNHGLLKCIKANKIEIDGKKTNKFLVGISNQNFFMDGIDCIINNRIMEELT